MSTGDTDVAAAKPSPEPQSQPPATAAPVAAPPHVESSINPTSFTSASTTAPIASRSTDNDVIIVPSYSRWFSWNRIHEGEVRFFPEFFDGRSPSKNPRVYKYYKNTIVRRFRENPTSRLNFTDVRKIIVGDAGSIRRVFDFLENWGLINYSGSAPKVRFKWDDIDAKASDDSNVGSAVSRKCSECNLVCSIACFACDKNDTILCARCYATGHFSLGLNSSNFTRVELNEEVKRDWIERETLCLLEGVMHFGDDWERIAWLVGGRSEKECVSRFIKLPFGEQFAGSSAELGSEQLPAKRMQLTPLADASNPIMAQAAFLSALAGAEVVEKAAHAALKSLSDFSAGDFIEHLKSTSAGTDKQDTAEAAFVEAKLQLDREEQNVEAAFSEVVVQVKEIEEKIAHFEKMDLQTEKELQQLQQLENLLFADQLNLMFNKAIAEEDGENFATNIKTD